MDKEQEKPFPACSPQLPSIQSVVVSYAQCLYKTRPNNCETEVGRVRKM